MKKSAIQLFILFLVSISIPEATAQIRYQSPKTMALGGGGVSYISDYQALFVNPANIYQRRSNTFMTIGLLGDLNVLAGGSILNIPAYNKYFTNGNVITYREFNNKVLPTFFDNRNDGGVGVNLDFAPVGASYGNSSWAIAVATRARVLANSHLSKGFAALGGGLNEDNFGKERPVDLNLSGVAFGEISAGFAMPVYSFKNGLGTHKIIAGVAPKFLFGMNYINIDFKSKMQVKSGDFIRHDVDYTISAVGGIADGIDRYLADKDQNDSLKFADLLDNYLDKPEDNAMNPFNGIGLGLDLGITYEWNPEFNREMKFTGAVSLTDIGAISFKKNAGVYGAKGSFLFSGIDYNNDRIKDEFDGELGDYVNYVISDSLADASYFNLKKKSSSYSYSLPTMLNVGFMFNWKKLTATLDFGKNFVNTGLASKALFVSTGAEYRVFSFLPVRLGTRLGGNSSAAYSFGTGLEFKNFEFTFAAVATPKTNSGLVVGAGLSTLIFRF